MMMLDSVSLWCMTLGVIATLLTLRRQGYLMLDELVIAAAMIFCSMFPVICIILAFGFSITIVHELALMIQNLAVTLEHRPVVMTRAYKREQVISKLTQ
jgi:hypothetical protein